MKQSSEPVSMADFYKERADAHKEMAERCADEVDRNRHYRVEKQFRELAATRILLWG